MEKFKRSTEMVSKVLLYISMGMLFVMMILTSADVIGRYFLNKPILGVLEISQILMAGIVLFALADTQLAGAHIKVHTIEGYLTPKIRVRLAFTIYFLLLCFFSIMTWRGINTAIIYWGHHRYIALLELPVYIPQLLLPIGAFGICLVFILEMLRSVSKMR